MPTTRNWSGVPCTGARWVIRPSWGYGLIPTNDDLTLVLAAWPQAEVAQVKQDLQGNYLREVTANLGDWLDGGRQETRVVGEGVPNRFRKPYGPGWALVGDAGYAKDPVTAQGITDAFCDAELCAEALDATWRGSRGYAEALEEYQQHRDERALPMYEFTSQLADLAVPRRRRCSDCSARSPVTRKPWTSSPACSPAPCPSRNSSTPHTSRP